MKDCKQQILSTIADNNCCSHAFIHSIIFSAGQINEKTNTIIINEQPDVLNKLIKIINNFYPSIEFNVWDNFLMLQGNLFELFNDVEFGKNLNLSLYPNTCDRLAILKALFITNGRFYYNQDSNKNSKGYSLELGFKNQKSADIAITLFKEFGFDLKTSKRYSSFVVYTKNSNVICDIFVLLGAGYTALEIQNNLAMREIRNNANRQNNCFESNLDKTLTASMEQINAINYILTNYSIDYLDDNLKEVALVRIANPEVSLGDLKILLGNKISRAGIKYRLDKIIQIYKNLKGQN